MTNVALWVRIEAKKGKEADVERLLRGSLPLVENEMGTMTWYAVRLGPSTFGIFDTFQDNKGREAHLSGAVAKALKDKTAELFSMAPIIEKADVLASKMSEMAHH